jgi:glycosyltransferase involved in cell wall biosynthesis
MSTIIFSIILPLYKQEAHIHFLLDTYCNALNETGHAWELLLVINGRKDNSFEVATEAIKGKNNVRVYDLEKAGWGSAVKLGMKEAKGKYVCYTNSARTNISDLLLILHHAKMNENAVTKATRIVRTSLARRLGSTVYALENRLLFKTSLRDINGTPKVFPAKILSQISLEDDGILFDAEVVAKCFRANIPIIEIPISNTERISGRSTTNLTTAIELFTGLFKLYKKISR